MISQPLLLPAQVGIFEFQLSHRMLYMEKSPFSLPTFHILRLILLVLLDTTPIRGEICIKKNTSKDFEKDYQKTHT